MFYASNLPYWESRVRLSSELLELRTDFSTIVGWNLFNRDMNPSNWPLSFSISSSRFLILSISLTEASFVGLELGDEDGPFDVPDS